MPPRRPADLVIDATGRRSPIDRWLDPDRRKPTATWQAECGVANITRHHRVRPAAELPTRELLLAALGKSS